MTLSAVTETVIPVIELIKIYPVYTLTSLFWTAVVFPLPLLYPSSPPPVSPPVPGYLDML